MKKTALLIASLLFSIILINAQGSEYQQFGRNGIYADVYLVRHDFSDGFVSLNYERMIGRRGRSAFRVGIYPDFESTLSFPLTYHWISSPSRNHHFEWGLGAVFRIEHYEDPYDPYQTREWFYDVPAVMVPIMYRFQKNSGLIIRAGINLFLSWPILPSPSFSIGYKF
jgi:hypothetical protein